VIKKIPPPLSSVGANKFLNKDKSKNLPPNIKFPKIVKK
jgi:hypothetical protein